MTIAVACVLYSYAGYPLLVMLLARLRAPRTRTCHPDAPMVSLLIAAHNEERVIAEKLQNSLALDWPPEHLEIVVASDGSTDRTNDIVRSFKDDRVRLVEIPENRGKLSALIQVIPRCRGEVVVLSDANSLYERDAVRHLAAALADPSVGAVCGELRYRNPDGSISGETEGLYWRYEKAIKRAESRFNTLIGANGSIYAIRRDDFVPPPPDLMDDLTIPLLIAVEHGRRTVYEPRAVATEEPGTSFAQEHRRKVRIITRAFHSLWRTAPRWGRRPLLAFQVLSHKVLRWLVPFFLLLFLFASTVLAAAEPSHPAVWLLLGAQFLFYAAGWWGHRRSRHARIGRLLGLVTYFCVVNLASLQGVSNHFMGRRYVTWKTIRES